MPARSLVFVSHASADTWIAKQIANHIRAAGAEVFLDEADIQIGDDFETRIITAAKAATELLVLLTPWSTERYYVWLEMGAFWGTEKRMLGVLFGMKTTDVAESGKLPVLLKRLSLTHINDIDMYFEQLKQRVSGVEALVHET